MFLIRPAGANQNAKVAIGGGGPLLGSAIYGMPSDSGPVIPAATPSLWYGANAEIAASVQTDIRSYQAQITNNTGYTWVSVAPLFFAMHSTPGQILGWRARTVGNLTWTTGTFDGATSYTPPPGAWSQYDSPAKLADAAVLPIVCPDGGQIVVEVVLDVGSHAVGKVTTNALPTTCTFSRRGAANQNSIAGDTMTWSSGFGQPWTHLYIGTDPAQGGIRKGGFGGDSLTAMVNPIADTPNTRREGYAIVSNVTTRTNGDAFRLVSFGRGTYTLAQMATFHPYLAAAIPDDSLDWMWAQGWSYNESPTSEATLTNRIASTQSVLDLWAAKGVRVGVNFMSPAGSARNSPTYLPYYTGAVDYWNTNASGKVVSLAASVADGTDPTIILPDYSQDGIHINIAGHPAHGAAAYAQTKAIFQAAGELP